MASSKSRALTRDIILSAALELVDDAGLSALSLRSLGKRLGVSQAAFYRHFPDKAALLEGICEQLWRLTYERFLALVQGGDAALDDAAPGAPATATAPAAPGALPRQPLPDQIQALIPSLAQARLSLHKRPRTRPCRRRNIFASMRTAFAPLCKITPTRSFC